MMNATKQESEPLTEKSKPGGNTESASESNGPSWETELDTYPLRSPSEDPRWAVRTAGCWVAFALASLAFVLLLVVLGALYD